MAGLGTIHPKPLVKDASAVGFCLQLLQSHCLSLVLKHPADSVKVELLSRVRLLIPCRFCLIAASPKLYLKPWTLKRAQWLPTRPNSPIHITLTVALPTIAKSSMSQKTVFPGMVQLDACVYFYHPITIRESNDGRTPQLIVLCTSMSARPAHITKYINGYQALYPHASILMLRSDPLDFVYRGRKAWEQRSESALAVVRSTCSSIVQGSTPRVILHIFSNGGSLQAATLLRSYHKATGQTFPLHSTILDSCPGRATFNVAFRVLAMSMDAQPLYIRQPVVALLYITFGLWWLTMIGLRMESPFETLWQGLNNMEQVNEMKRVYMYSEVDDMVPWHDIEDHAAEARRFGFNVELEKFEGSGHVAHVRVGHGERYWRIVERSWNDSVG